MAEWIRAETGVGPSIAAGSQTCSGNCPLLPTAPLNSSRAIRVTWPPEIAPEAMACSASPKEKPPASTLSTRMPTRNPRSPKRVTTKAFLAALAAAGRSYQKPISR